MSGIEVEPWEPEETIGKLWHAYASRLDAPEVHEGAAVDLSEVGGRLAIFFRALGGGHDVEIKPVEAEASEHRLSRRRQLGTATEYVMRASFDGAALRLPARLSAFSDKALNASLYLWLAAAAAHAPAYAADDDPLRADLRALAAMRETERRVLAECPGLAELHYGLAALCLRLRPSRSLPKWEAAVEACIRHLLGSPEPSGATAEAVWDAILQDGKALSALQAPRGYRPFAPVPMWPELRGAEASAAHEDDAETPDGETEQLDGKTRRAKRRKSDEAARNDSLILHKFEAILSWAEFLNLNRRVEDDDLDNAKKAADDQDEIGLGQVSKAPATRLKLHLDLAPADVDREKLSGTYLYPEWDAKTGAYMPAHVRVLASEADPCPEPEAVMAPDAKKRVRAVKRQFEALRPRRVVLPGQADGDDLDLDAAVRAQVELAASGRGSDRIWRASKPEARDLAVSILLDTSRSTESAVTGRAVIDIEREALTALAWGLESCGDDLAIHAFSSLRRDRVFVLKCKGFDEPMGTMVERRIAGLRPGFYTRLGAAIRHVSADLAEQRHARRLLLVITDGKPNDLDHYEGRHGIEDSRLAVREARLMGHAVHGVLVEAKGKAWFPRLFGRGGFSVVPHPDRLTTALPEIYRHLVGA